MAKPRRKRASAFVAFTGLVGLCLAHAVLAQGDVWAAKAPLPTPRRLLAAAADGGKIYTFGGCGSPCFEPPLHTSTFEETRVEVYDAGLNAWQVKQPMTAVLFGAAAAAPGNGRIYTFGGYVTGNLTQEYDPATDTWSKKRPLPTARYGLAAVALDGKVYVLGGSDGNGPSGALEVYDPAANTWKLKARMPTARVFLAAAALDGKIYAIGGSPDCCGNSKTAAVEIYDPDRDAWTTGAPLPVAEQTSAAAAVNGKIYVFGGFIPGAGAQRTTFEYDPATGSWTARALMPTPRDQAPAVVVDGQGYVLGGAVDCHCSALAANESYTPHETPIPVDLSLTKSDFRDAVCAGEETSYVIVVENRGLDAVTGAEVTDTPTANLGDVHWSCESPSGGSCSAPDKLPLVGSVSLPAGKAARFFVTGTVSGGKSVGNTATVFAAEDIDTSNNTATDTDTVSARDFSLTAKDVNATCTSLNFTLVATNVGPAADGVIVTVVIPPGLTAGALSPLCAIEAGTLVCALTAVPASGSVEIPVTFQIPTCFAGANPISVSAFLGGGDCNSTDDQVSLSVPFECKADLTIEKSAPATVQKDEPIQYTLKVTNNGPDTACGATLSDPLPPGLGAPQPPNRCTVTPANEVVCAIGDLAPGADFVAGFSESQSEACGTEISNPATVSSGTADPNANNNSATAMTTVACCDLAIAKTVDAAAAMPGQTIHYTIVAGNPGGEDVAAATVTDSFPDGLTKTRWCRDTAQFPCTPSHIGDLHDVIPLPANAQVTYRAQGIISAMFTGLLRNTATIAGPVDCQDLNAANNVSMADTVVSFQGVKAFCKSIEGVFVEGGTITYTFVLLNGGPAAQADNPGNEFTDPLPASLTLMSVGASSGIPSMAGNTAFWNGGIPVGGMVTITVTAKINLGTAGTTICNQASIAFDSDGDGINESNAVTDDPGQPGDADPCCFRVAIGIPALSAAGLAALALLLAGLALLRLRRRSP